MEVIIKEHREEAVSTAAKIVRRAIKRKPNAVLGLATGRTPVTLYKELIRMHQEEGLDFSQVQTFNLDEYIGLSPEHVQSYRYFMDTELFNHINIKQENTHLPSGTSEDPRQECHDYEAKIKDSGGIDIQVLGLGSNGHIGFNEPTGSLNSRTWVKILSKQTIKDNSDLFNNPNEVPHYCITMGIGTILEARHCIILAFGHKKAKAVSHMIEDPVTSMCPASALQQHRRVTTLIDEEAAARLDFIEHYKWINANKLDWQRYE